MTDWLTTPEAATILGRERSWTHRLLTRKGVRKLAGQYDRAPVRWDGDQVRALAGQAIGKARPKGTFCNGRGERLEGGVADYMDTGPAKPEDVEKYNCLHGWFQHKPLPIVNGRLIRRAKAFCPECKANMCYFHSELTPEQMAKGDQVRTKYPEHPVHDYHA